MASAEDLDSLAPDLGRRSRGRRARSARRARPWRGPSARAQDDDGADDERDGDRDEETAVGSRALELARVDVHSHEREGEQEERDLDDRVRCVVDGARRRSPRRGVRPSAGGSGGWWRSDLPSLARSG